MTAKPDSWKRKSIFRLVLIDTLVGSGVHGGNMSHRVHCSGTHVERLHKTRRARIPIETHHRHVTLHLATRADPDVVAQATRCHDCRNICGLYWIGYCVLNLKCAIINAVRKIYWLGKVYREILHEQILIIGCLGVS